MSTTFQVTRTTASVLDIQENVVARVHELLSQAGGFVARRRTRKILHSLSDRQLEDIGIDPSTMHAGPSAAAQARVMHNLLTLR